MGKKKESSRRSSGQKPPEPGRAVQAVVRKYGLVCFVAVWMFVLGVMVGRETVPVQFDIQQVREELAALRESMVRDHESRFKIDSKQVAHSTEDLGFHEALKTEAEPETIAPAKPEAKPDEAVPHKTAKVGKNKNRAHIPATKSTAVHSKVAAAGSSGGVDSAYVVQVASLKDAREADNMIGRLRKLGYAAYRVQARITGKGTWYRVRISGFKSKADARQVLERLRKQKFSPMLLHS